MTDYNVLSKEMHLNLRVITAHGKQYGDNVMHAMTFPHEFRDVQSTSNLFARIGRLVDFIPCAFPV